MGRLWRAGALTSAWALCVTLLIASPAMAAGPVRLGSAPAVPDGARIVSAVPATTQLHVTVTLQSQDPAGLTAFATEVSTPGSPLYRDYITPAEFAQRFGATPQAVQAVDSSLESHGLVPGAVSANSLSIPVTASAGSLSAAFATSFSRVALADGTSAIVNSQAPSLDSTIAPDVQGVLGLSTVSVAKPLLIQAHDATAHAAAARPHVVTGGPQPCVARQRRRRVRAASPPIRSPRPMGCPASTSAGGPNATPDEGAGQTVAILELESYDPSDIAALRALLRAERTTAGSPDRERPGRQRSRHRARPGRGRARHRERDRRSRLRRTSPSTKARTRAAAPTTRWRRSSASTSRRWSPRHGGSASSSRASSRPSQRTPCSRRPRRRGCRSSRRRATTGPRTASRRRQRSRSTTRRASRS